MTMIGPIVVALFGLVLTATFATLHLALVDLARIVLTELAEEHAGTRRAERVRRILADVQGHAVSLGLVRVGLSMLTVFGFVWWLGPAAEHGPRPDMMSVAGAGIALAVVTAALGAFGLIVPHSVARHAGEHAVFHLASVVRLAHLACWPARRMGQLTDEGVRRLTGASRDVSDAIETDLMSVIDEGQQGGQFDDTEREMIEAVVDLRERTVEQIMTPRTDMAALQYTDDLRAVQRAVRDIGHSRIPVYDDNLDHVLGVLYAKDLLHYLSDDAARGARFELRPLLRPAVFVPESKTVRDLMAQLLESKVHIALVADEYGGTSGLVTIEDIVEEIFGEIQDEYEEDGSDGSVDIDPEARAAELDARTYINDANDALEAIGVELPESDDYDTVGGFVVVTLGRIPEVGDRLEHQGVAVTVTQAEPTRVTRVRVEPVAPVEPSPVEAADRGK